MASKFEVGVCWCDGEQVQGLCVWFYGEQVRVRCDDVMASKFEVGLVGAIVSKFEVGVCLVCGGEQVRGWCAFV